MSDKRENSGCDQPGTETQGQEGPPGDAIGAVTRASMEQEIERLKGEIRTEKGILQGDKIIRKHKPLDEALIRKITDREVKITGLKRELKNAEEYLKSRPLEDSPDEEQPWFGRVYSNGTGYYIEDGRGSWTQVTEENAKRELRTMGISHRPDTETTSPLDRALLAIQKRYKVEYAGPLAGYRAGVTKQNGMNILVTSTTELIHPVRGEFPVLDAILNGLLKEDRVYFDAFCRVTYEGLKLCLETDRNTPGPVLVLAGPKHCGKSLIQYHVLTPLLGGKLARPYLFMSGQTSFNGELASAGHHMLEDEVPAKDISARRKFGNYIKKAAANKGVEIHGKGKDIKNLTPFTRLSVSVNDDEECLEVLPPLDDHLTDKLLILLCHKFPFPMPANTPAEQAALEAAIKKELPGYIYWLLNVFQIPEHIKEGGRGGFKVIQNQEILEKINGTAPELQLREMLEHIHAVEPGSDFSGKKKCRAKPEWFKLGTAQEVFNNLTGNPYSPVGRNLLPSIKTCGTYLSRLAEKFPDEFRRYRGHGGIYRYEMKLDPKRIQEIEADL